MAVAIIMSIVAMMLGIEWLSLLVLGLWAMGIALWLIVQMGEHNAL